MGDIEALFAEEGYALPDECVQVGGFLFFVFILFFTIHVFFILLLFYFDNRSALKCVWNMI